MCRKADGKRAAHSRTAFKLNSSSVSLSDVSDQRQPQAGTRNRQVFSHLRPIESFENARLLVLGYADPMISNLDHCVPILWKQPQLDGAAFPGILHRIGEQIQHGLL